MVSIKESINDYYNYLFIFLEKNTFTLKIKSPAEFPHIFQNNTAPVCVHVGNCRFSVLKSSEDGLQCLNCSGCNLSRLDM